MKKFTKVFVIACLVLVLVLCATACSLQKDAEGRYILVAPKVAIENDLVTWEVVGNGKKYYKAFDIKIGEKVVENITDTHYSLAEVEPGATVSVQVRARGDGEKTVSSPYSEALSYKAPMRLAAPTDVKILEENDNAIVLGWLGVDNATAYDIQQTEEISGIVHWYRKINTTSYSIPKSNVSTSGKYSYKVIAKSDSREFSDSGLSISKATYIKSEKLANPKAELSGYNISFGNVDDATNYRIYMLKIDPSWTQENPAETFKDQAIAVDTVAKSTSSYSETNVNSALEVYKTKWEDANKGQKFDVAGKYFIYIQAIHEHSDVFLDSDKIVVTKTNGEGENSETQIVQFTKLGKPTNIKINYDEVVEAAEDGKPEVKANVLHWDSVSDRKNYVIKFYSNSSDTSVINTNVSENSDNLTKRFESAALKHRGKVLEISITARAEFSEGILSGEETYFTNTDGSHAIYCDLPKELKKIEDEKSEYNGYYEISNLGDLYYMMTNSTAGNKYYLSADIDGGMSGVNCNFYAGNMNFEGLFDGSYKVISNVNLIVKDNKQAINLFNEITSGAIFKNVTFSNITITTESGDVNNVALIAGVNNGIIQNVNLVASKFETLANTAGLVITNNGQINGCGVLGTTITAKGYIEEEDSEEKSEPVITAGKQVYAAAIAVNNNDTIFNASIYGSTINAISRLVNVKAGGIATVNNQIIKNSFVKNTLVNAKTLLDNTRVSAIAGGITALSSGDIYECYVDHRASTAIAVQANSGKLNTSTSSLEILSIAGGLVGEMTGGSIKRCYVNSLSVTANTNASGMVGIKGNAAITIENGYVSKIQLNAKDRAMVLTETEGVTVNNIYTVKRGINANENNVIEANRITDISKLDTIKIDGFAVYKTDYSEQLLIKNMLYTNKDKYQVEYSKNANRELSVYYVHDFGKTNCNDKEIYAASLSESGKKVDLYYTTVTTDGSNMQLVLPIYVTVKS